MSPAVPMTDNQADLSPSLPVSADGRTTLAPCSPEPLIQDCAGGQRVWQSDQLLGRDPEVIIMHQGKAYRLRSTRQGKLILYK